MTCIGIHKPSRSFGSAIFPRSIGSAREALLCSAPPVTFTYHPFSLPTRPEHIECVPSSPSVVSLVVSRISIDSIPEHRVRQARPSVCSSVLVCLHSVSHGRISIESFLSPSIVASLVYGASPIDPTLKPGSPAHQSPDLSRLDPPSADISATSHSAGADTERQFSPVLPHLRSFGKTSDGSNSDYKDTFAGLVSVSTSLPGLAALASVASAPTSNLR